jgi:hypothetical protein
MSGQAAGRFKMHGMDCAAEVGGPAHTCFELPLPES